MSKKHIYLLSSDVQEPFVSLIIQRVFWEARRFPVPDLIRFMFIVLFLIRQDDGLGLCTPSLAL